MKVLINEYKKLDKILLIYGFFHILITFVFLFIFIML